MSNALDEAIVRAAREAIDDGWLMVDAGGNNNVMVLPLDKLMQNVVVPTLPVVRDDGTPVPANRATPVREAFDPQRATREPRQ